MRTLEIINLILLALNFCFFLASNWLINASNEFYLSVMKAEEALKEMCNALDKKYDYVTEQHKGVMEQYETVYKQYKTMRELFDLKQKEFDVENDNI